MAYAVHEAFDPDAIDLEVGPNSKNSILRSFNKVCGAWALTDRTDMLLARSTHDDISCQFWVEVTGQYLKDNDPRHIPRPTIHPSIDAEMVAIAAQLPNTLHYL